MNNNCDISLIIIILSQLEWRSLLFAIYFIVAFYHHQQNHHHPLLFYFSCLLLSNGLLLLIWWCIFRLLLHFIWLSFGSALFLPFYTFIVVVIINIHRHRRAIVTECTIKTIIDLVFCGFRFVFFLFLNFIVPSSSSSMFFLSCASKSFSNVMMLLVVMTKVSFYLYKFVFFSRYFIFITATSQI